MLMMKKEGEARIKGNRDVHERKRNLLVLIAHHLVREGYIDTASCLQRQVSFDLEKFEVADNIDLFYCLQDFEAYYEIKFSKKPIMVKKLAEAPIKSIFSKKPPQNNMK